MLRALKHAFTQLKARRQAQRAAAAQARCDRLMGQCANPAQLAVLAYAAGRYPNPVQRVRVLRDLNLAFNQCVGA